MRPAGLAGRRGDAVARRGAGDGGVRGTISFWAWRSGVIATTFHTRPTFSIAADDHADGSSSQRPRPWRAERGNAWWLWCQDSPSDGSASHQTLVDWSSTSKRRRPKKWQTELIAPRDVVQEEDPHEAAPEQAGQRARRACR